MTIEERLENMERELGCQKRRNRWMLGAILLLAGGLIVPAVFETTAFRARAQVAGTAKVIRAEAFVLEDENGKTRASLALIKNGPALALYDEKGQPRASLAVNKDGSGLELWDEKGKKARISLTVDKYGPGLMIRDENDKVRAGMAVSKDGPALGLWDENDNIRAGIAVGNGGPSLELSDEKGQARFVAGGATTISPDRKTIEYPESSLILFGPDGKVIWSAIK